MRRGERIEFRGEEEEDEYHVPLTKMAGARHALPRLRRAPVAVSDRREDEIAISASVTVEDRDVTCSITARRSAAAPKVACSFQPSGSVRTEQRARESRTGLRTRRAERSARDDVVSKECEPAATPPMSM